jgi:hypothetical protein
MRKVYETAGLSAYHQKTNEFLRKHRDNGKYRSPLTIALHYAIAGADSEALNWLEKAVEERAPWLPELKIDPTWDGLRSQPRFEALVQKVFAPKNTEAESAEQVPGKFCGHRVVMEPSRRYRSGLFFAKRTWLTPLSLLLRGLNP